MDNCGGIADLWCYSTVQTCLNVRRICRGESRAALHWHALQNTQTSHQSSHKNIILINIKKEKNRSSTLKHSCSFKTEKKKKEKKKRKTSFLIDVIRQEQRECPTDKYKERKKKIFKSKTKSCPSLAPLQDIEQNKEINILKGWLTLTKVNQNLTFPLSKKVKH